MSSTDDGADGRSVERALGLADREWRSMGIVAADRVRLARDLRMELAGAAADGMTPEQLVGDDVRRFAHDLAAAAGVRRAPYEFRRLLLTGLAGGVPGLALAYLLAWKWWWLPLHPMIDPDSPVPGVFRYGLSALVFVVGVLLAVRRGMRGRAGVDRTVVRMALLVPPAGILSIPVVIGFAAVTGYSLALPVLLVEAGIVGGALAGATVLARRWALSPILNSAQPPAEPPGSPRVVPG